jgi:hypothetical protein
MRLQTPTRRPIAERGRSSRSGGAKSRRYGRQSDLWPGFVHGDRTGDLRGPHRWPTSDSADVSEFAPWESLCAVQYDHSPRAFPFRDTPSSVLIPSETARSMLLCLVKGLKCHFLASFFGYGENALSRLLDCGQDREGPLGCEGKLLLGHAQQVRMGPGDGRRIVSRPARMRQPIRGPGRPRELGSVRELAGAGRGRPRGRRNA